MKTQRFEVARLRGMDTRWRVSPDSAAEIREMTWDLYDGWRTAGAYDLITGSTYDWGGTTAPGLIHSLHYLSRHNGSTRDILFEDSTGSLRRIDTRGFVGSPRPHEALIDIRGDAFNGSTRSRFVPDTSTAGTQSITFGGRLYMVNGHDEPSVYDGRVVSRAGFNLAPGQPSATVIFREYFNEYIALGGVFTRFFLGTRVRGQGLGSCSPKGEAATYDFEPIDRKKRSSPSYVDEAKEVTLYPDGKQCGYQYRVTFVNRRGQESPMSEASEVCEFECASGKRRFTCVTIPVGDADVVARRVYRTRDIYDDNGNSISPEIGRNFYLVKEIQDNEATTFEDGVMDSNLGRLTDPEDFGPFPTQARFISSFKNTVFLAGMPDNLVRFSAPGMPEVFPRDNVFDLGGSGSGEITGMYSTTNALIVFKEHGVYLVKGDPSRGFVAQTLNRDIGCIAPNSIRDVPQTGLVFLSSNGVYVIKGALENTGSPTSIVELSTPIQRLMDRVSFSAAGSAVSVINRDNKEFWLCVPTIGKKNNLLLVWHYEVGAWSYRENYPIQCATEIQGRRPYVLFGSHDTVNAPGIHVFSDFYRTKNESGVDSGTTDLQGGETKETSYKSTLDYPLYETSPFSFGDVYSGIQIGYINCYAVAYGDDPMKVNFKVNRSEIVALDENKARKQQHVSASEQLPLYGKAKFGSSSWGFHRPIVLRYDISHMHKTTANEFSIQFKQDLKNENPNRMMVVGWSVDAKVGEQRNIRALTDVLTSNKR